jgi:hypothetical protein
VKQSQQGLQMAQKMFGGKLDKEDFSKASPGGGNPEKEIQALLSPEQQAAYKEYKQEDNAANARLMANAQMLQIHNSVRLTPEQQEKVFPILYEQSLNQMNPDASRADPKSTDPNAIVQRQFDEKMKAMETILTPEQFQSFRSAQESQLKLIKSFLPSTKAPPPVKPVE